MRNKYLEKLASVSKGAIIGATAGAVGSLFTGEKNNTKRDKLKRGLAGAAVGSIVGGAVGLAKKKEPLHLTTREPINPSHPPHSTVSEPPHSTVSEPPHSTVSEPPHSTVSEPPHSRLSFGKKMPDGSFHHILRTHAEGVKAFNEVLKVPGTHHFYSDGRIVASRGKVKQVTLYVPNMNNMSYPQKMAEIKKLKKKFA
jgi:hypothetical protein